MRTATVALLQPGLPEARTTYTTARRWRNEQSPPASLRSVVGRDGGDAGPLRDVLRELPILGVLAVVAAGLVLGAVRQWRAGALVIAAGLLLAAVLRLVLPARRAGLLVVRSRRLDVATLLLLGAALMTLASSVPEP